MARYAIGDVHGGSKTLRALIARIALRRGDRLYLLGDLVDRGPDSRGVLDTVINLQMAGYDVRPIRGNHEDMLLRNITGEHDRWSLDWRDSLDEERLKSFGVAALEELREPYLNLLISLPLLALEPDYLLVHAGLKFDAPDPLHDSLPVHMLWHESGVSDRRRVGGRVAVTGHNYRPLREIESSLNQDRIHLDNGAYTAMLPNLGNLAALDLDRKRLVLQPWLDGA